MNSKRTGFTLVEILVASTIGAFISMIAVGTLQTVIRSNDMTERNINAAAEVRFAANMLKKDITNMYKTDDYLDSALFGTIEVQEDYGTAYMVFYTVNRAKARLYEPECDIYEVEYYLQLNEEGTFSLMRRIWPNPNEYYEPGGILSVIAENLDTFEVSYYDGEEWWDEWTEEMEAIPDLIEVSLVTRPKGLGNEIVETFLINLVRSVNETPATVQ